MPIRKYKPTSPARRFYTVQVFDEITTQDPYRPLVEPLRKSGGRNNHGELTSWWRGGGHKRNYRIIDFKRDKHGIPATVSTVEYDPNRSARNIAGVRLVGSGRVTARDIMYMSRVVATKDALAKLQEALS